MKLTKLFRIKAEIGDSQPVGNVPGGLRSIAVVTGGEFEGDKLSGAVLPPAADWVLVDAEGWGRIDVRLTLRTNDGVNLYMHYLGWLHMTEGFGKAMAGGEATEFGDNYFVTHPSLECSDERYAWVNHLVCVAEGRAVPGGVEYQVYACEPG